MISIASVAEIVSQPGISSTKQTQVVVIVIVIIIAFKGTIRDFLQSPHCAVNRLPTCMLKWPRRNRAKITCNTLSAYHMQHVVLRATWYEGTAQL